MIWASAASVPSKSCHGMAPTATKATRTYRTVTMPSESMIARGRSFFGSLASSPAVEAASKPMYEKKRVEAPAAMPLMPSGASGA